MDIDVNKIREVLWEYRSELVIPVWVLMKKLGIPAVKYPQVLDFLEKRYSQVLMPCLYPHKTLLLNPKINRRCIKKHGTWKLIPVRYLKATLGTKWERSATALISVHDFLRLIKNKGELSD